MLSFARGVSAARVQPSERTGKPPGLMATHPPAPAHPNSPQTRYQPWSPFPCKGRPQLSDGA